MNSQLAGLQQKSIKWELHRHFRRLAEGETRYQPLWRRAAARALELEDQDPALEVLIRTGNPGDRLRSYFLDMAGWDSLADLATRSVRPAQGVTASAADVEAFVDAVVRDIASGPVRERPLLDLWDEDVEAIRVRNRDYWTATDPEDVSPGAPLAELAAKSRSFGDLVEMAVAAGYQTDAIRPVVLSFHYYCLRQAMRAEALGALGDVESLLRDDLYDGLVRFISELGAEMRDMRESTLAG